MWACIWAYCLTKRGVSFVENPRISSATMTCPSHCGEAPIPMVGMERV